MAVKIANYAKVLISHQITHGRYTGVKTTHKDESVKQKNVNIAIINFIKLTFKDVTLSSIFERNNCLT